MLFAQMEDVPSVEESYLDEHIELRIMSEGSKAIGRSQKLEALDFIEAYLEAGNVSPDAQKVLLGILINLSLQGTLHKERVNGVPGGNSYPDVRWRAITYLGEIPKSVYLSSPPPRVKEAAAPASIVNNEWMLQFILLNEEEPEAAIAAVTSLKKIGSYENNSIIALEKSFRKFDAGQPNNRLALAVIDYYDAAPAPKPRSMAETIDYIRGSPNYDYRVRARADKIIKDFVKSFYKGR
jgi:hypothetical protein